MLGRTSGLFVEVTRFGGVGLAATATHYATALLLSRELDVDPAWAVFLGVNASALVSYLGHGRITFRRTLDHGTMLPRFVASMLVAYAISYFGSRVLLSVGPLPDYVIYAIVIATIIAVNFILFRFWVFR